MPMLLVYLTQFIRARIKAHILVQRTRSLGVTVVHCLQLEGVIAQRAVEETKEGVLVNEIVCERGIATGTAMTGTGTVVTGNVVLRLMLTSASAMNHRRLISWPTLKK